MNIIQKLILLYCLSSLPLYAQQSLEIKVMLPKSSYYIDEPIEIGLSVINKGSIIEKDLNYGTTLINLIDSGGNILPYTGPLGGDPFSPSANELRPGEEDYKVISIVDCFGKGRPHFSNNYLLPGKYTIEVIFKPHNNILEKSRLSIEVTEPVGDELLVHNQYINAISKSKTPEECTEALRKLADAHPGSIYLPLILVNLGSLLEYWVKDSKNAQKARDELIAKCSGSSVTYGYILSKLKQLNQKDIRLNFLKKIKENNPNSINRKHIDKLIQEETKQY